MTYDEFIEARNVVLARFPKAVCQYTYGSYKIFIDDTTTNFYAIIASSDINEPAAWMESALEVQWMFLNILEN